MKVTDTKFAQGFIKMCNDGWNLGWHERNGGNLSYRMKKEETEEILPCLDRTGEWREIGTTVPGLAGEFFMVTGSGKYFRNVILDPEDSTAINGDGKREILPECDPGSGGLHSYYRN